MGSTQTPETRQTFSLSQYFDPDLINLEAETLGVKVRVHLRVPLKI